MNSEELIASGELELYVAGLLPETRNKEIAELISTDKAIQKKVDDIEKVVMRLAEESTTSSGEDFTGVLKKIVTQRIPEDYKVKSIDAAPQQKTISFGKVAGWAAAAVLLVLFSIQFYTSNKMEKTLNASLKKEQTLKDSLQKQFFELNYNENLLATLTSENTKIVDLAGQDISPDSKVRAYWNTQENKVIIDAKGLPEAPENMVYQVWSLKLSPLTPTSIGLLENDKASNSLFVLDNSNASEAFGITLEPAGGSPSPTLEQLYVLGTTNS